MIEVELHDGTIAEFPDGTSTDVMTRVAGNYAGLKAPLKPPAARAPVNEADFDPSTGAPITPAPAARPTTVLESFEARQPRMPAPVTPGRQFADAQARLRPAPTFNPEGAEYDMASARAAGLQPDETGHWPSRVPESGLLLKGRGHETWAKTLEGERAAGMEVYQGSDGRWYSRAPERPARMIDDLVDMKMGRELRPRAQRQPTAGDIAMQIPEGGPGTPRAFADDAGGVFRGTNAEFEKEHGAKTGIVENAAKYPDRWTYGLSGDIVAAQRWLTQVDSEIVRLEGIVNTGRVPMQRTMAGQQGNVARPATQVEIDGANSELPRLTAERDRLESMRSGAKAAERDVTPKNESTMSKAVGTLGRSAASTLAGVGAGMVAGPVIGYAVGMGLGAAQQGAGTFADVIEAGADAKARLASFASQPDKVAYLKAIVDDPEAPDTVKKSAVRVMTTMEDIDARLKNGMVGSRAARQMAERAIGSFKRDLEFIARGADAGYANVSAGIDAAAEAAGEALGLGPLLRTMKMTGLAKAGFIPSFIESVATNYGQEYATQLAQTLNAAMRADPNVTLKEALEQAHEAGIAGAVMGGALHPPMYAAGKSAEAADWKARGFGGTPLPPAAPGFTPRPTAAAVAVRAIQPGTRGDLESIMGDARPLAEIRAAQAREQQEALAPHVEQAASTAAQQTMVDGAAQDETAVAAGIPKRGEQAIITWPDGEVQRVTVQELYPAKNEATGDAMTGAVVELENGQVINLTTADAKISPVPLGDGTPASPIVAETPTAIEHAGARVVEPTPAQAEAGNYRKGHVDFQGLNVTIETPNGEVRRGKDPKRPWQVTMPAHYGYVKRTEGADGDQVDVYIGDRPQSMQVWIVDQIDPATKKFDEHKVMLGFPTAVDAMRAYRAGFSDGSGPSRMGKIAHLSMADFKQWLKHADTTKPVAYVEPKPVPPEKPETAPDSAFNGDLEHALNQVFQSDEHDGKPIGLTNKGFRQDEIDALKAVGLASADGTMSVEQYKAWMAERSRRLAPKPKGEPHVPTQETSPVVEQQPGSVETEIRGETGPAIPEEGGDTGPTGGGYTHAPAEPRIEAGAEEPRVEQPQLPEPVATDDEGGGPGVVSRPAGPETDQVPAGPVDVEPVAPPIAPPVQPLAPEPEPPVVEPPAPPVAPEPPKEPVIEKQPKAPKEPKPPKEKKPALTASEKLHGEIMDALENNDRDALGKIIYQDVPVTDVTRPEIDPQDRIVRLVVKTAAKSTVQDRLADLGFKVSDLQDVTADDGTAKDGVLKMSAIYRPSKEKIGDFGKKIGGKRADEPYNPKDIEIKLSADVDAEKAVEKILAAIAKKRLVTAEMPGQSFGQFMLMEALWERALAPGEFIAEQLSTYNMAAWKASIIEHYGRAGGPEKVQAIAKNYADTLLAVQKLVEGKQRVEETAAALRAGLAIDNDLNRETGLGADFLLVWGKSLQIIQTLERKFGPTEDSTDQTNREVKKDDDPAPLAEIIRKGKDWRKGANITDAAFLETFGFRGVDFGNWMTVDERQAGLNYAYDAAMDLADMIGVPPKAIGLGGTLGFGIGSRGVGNRGGRTAAATYHPDNRVINLTKVHGNGTFYHEWMHAIEDYLRKYIEDTAIGHRHTDALRGAMRFKPAVSKLEPMFRAKLSEDASTGKDRNVPPKERALAWANDDMAHRGQGWWTEHYGIRRPTEYHGNAMEMDGGREAKYWATPHELVARAFESFTYDESKGKSPYGVGPHVADGVYTAKNGFKGTAYPGGAERAYITQVMKWFVSALEVSETGAISFKLNALTVAEHQQEDAKKELARLVGDVDKIMEEMGIRQYPELKDGSMVESMFYHMRFGWWPKDKHALKNFVAQAHKKNAAEVDDLLLRTGAEDFEAAMARFAGQLIQDWKKQGLDDRAIYDKLFGMYQTQPRLDIRTSSSVTKQQYSTPLPIAYVAGLLGHVDAKTVIYDPTAGNGLLGITANPKKFIANELDDRRHKNLTILETRAHHGDALDTHDRNVYKAQEADTVLMNPPFGLMTDPQKTEAGHVIKRLDQWIAINNMDAMADKGRAVLILGAAREAGVINQNEMDFFHWLWTNYNVVDHFEITGALYERQGASWPIRVLVIAGRSPSKLPRPVSGQVDRLENRDDLWTRVTEARAKAAAPVAGGVSPRVVGPGTKPLGDGRKGKPGDVGGAIPPSIPGKTGGVDGQPGPQTRTGDDSGGAGTVPPGVVLPGGSGPDDLGAQPRGPAGLPVGEPGSIEAGERGAGAAGDTGTGRTVPVGDNLGGSGLTSQDLDDIFGGDAPASPERPKIKTKRVPGDPKPPRKTRKAKGETEPSGDDTARVGTPMPGPALDDGNLVGALDAIDAILAGRASAPKPFPAGAVKKSGNSTEDLTAGQAKTLETKVADQGEWWVSDLVDEVFAEAKPALDAAPDSDVVFMGKQGPQLDATILQKLRPHFEQIWKVVLEKAKAARDAAIAFRDLVVGKWGAKVLAYAKAFIVEKMRQVKAANQKAPINNAIETPDQVFYQGLSSGKNEGVMMPASQLEHSKRALAALDARLRNEYPDGIDQFVKEMVGYKSIEEMHQHLFGYQVDGVALQIDAMMNNAAFIVGDDTGVGKGRQAAALVVWAQRQGLVPIFMTAQDNLYSDLYRDLEGIGFDEPNWIQPTNADWTITNEYDEMVAEPAKGEATGNSLAVGILKKLNGTTNDKGEVTEPVDMSDPANFMPKGRKAIFTTYAQNQGPAGTTRRSLIEKLVKEKRAILILDESHKAAGESGVGKWLVKMQTDHQPKVAFFSATFAKRADSLPLYMRTDLHHVAPTVAEVIDTIVSGGPQMQVTISEMLIEAGQMVRRERSYNGIVPKFDVDEANSAIDTRTMDEVTDRLRAILSANREFNAWAKENPSAFQAVAEGIFMEQYPTIWVSNVAAGDLEDNLGAFNFASTVHNYVKQFLLAVKADRIVKGIVLGMNQENPEGTQQKFVIGLENTMEAALDDFTDMESVKPGDSMEGYSWRSVLSRAERRARTVSLKIVGSKDKRVRIVLPTEMIPGHVQSSFRRAQAKIATYESELPASPIDYMRWQLGRNFVWEEGGKVRVGDTPPAGAAKVRPFVTSEITGRNNIVVYDDEGGMTLGRRDDPTKRGTLNGFQNGGIDATILNISGTTGLSMHPNAKVSDQRVRHMLIAQPLGDINEFKQLAGRINRTGQVELPLYTFIGTALPAEKRPLAVLRKKLRFLTSNTKSATESAQDLDLTDFVNQYGDEIVTRWLREHPEYVDLLNIKMPESETSIIDEGAMKASGKIAVLEVVDQAAFYDEVEHNYETYIKELTASGENKLIRRALPLRAQRLGENELGEGDPHASSPFLKGSFIQKISAATQHEVPTPEILRAQIEEFYDSLEGKAEPKPTDVIPDIEAQLKVPFDESMNQVILQIQGYEKQLEDAEMPHLEREKVNAVLGSVKQKAQAFTTRKQQTLSGLRQYLPGNVLKVNVDEQEYTGIVTSLGYMKPTGGHGNPYAPSRFRISISLNAPRPKLTMTLARIEAFNEGENKFFKRLVGNLKGNPEKYETGYAIDALDKDFDATSAKAAGGRETRYMVVGNIPAGFNMVNNRGEIVVFTYDPEGPLGKEYPQGRAGVLLPHKFNPAKDISESFPIKNTQAGALMLMLPLYRNIRESDLFKGHSGYEDLIKKANDDWLDLEWTGEEMFAISTTGITDGTGAVELKVHSRYSTLTIEIDRKKGGKLGKEIATDARLIELAGHEFSMPKQGDWKVNIDLTEEKRDLITILEYFKGKYGLSVPMPLRDTYKRIRDTLAERDQGEIKFMGMAVPVDPKGVSDEARKVAANTTGRKLYSLRMSIEKLLGKQLSSDMFTKGVLRDSVAAGLKEIENFFGLTVIPFKNSRPDLIDFNGAALPTDNSVMFLNADANVPHLMIAAHESLHLIRQQNEALYQRIVTRIRPLMRDMPKYQAYITRGRNGLEASMSLTEEELIADLFGEAMLDPAFAARLYGRDPSVFQRAYSFLIRVLDALGLHLTKQRGSAKYVTDVRAARDVLAKVLNEHYAARPSPSTFQPALATSKVRSDLQAVVAKFAGYEKAPDWALGFRKQGPQKGWDEQKYKFVQYVEVSWPDGQKMIDAQKGLNAPHALERARRNWPDATIKALTKDEAVSIDPSVEDGTPKMMATQPPGITVIDKQATREGMLPAKRFMWNPANAFQGFPVIAQLQRFAVRIENEMSKVQRRFMSEFEDMRKKLTDAQWDELSDVLFVGDAEAVEWTDAELREHGITDPKLVTAYREFRTLITKVGRLVDMHRRSMLPKYRARKQALLERMRTLRNMTDPEFRALYGRRTRLLAQIRAGEGNVEALHVRLDAVEAELNVKRESMDEFQDLQEQVDHIDAILAQTSIRRRVGYVPHKFFGTFAVYRAQEEVVIDPETLEPVLDAAGDPVTRPINVLVAGEHGFYPTQADAIAAAKGYLAANPGTDLTVRPVQFKFPNSAATTLTDASYWRLMSRMGQTLGLSGQDLKDAIDGVARRRFRRRIAGFTKLRTGVEGFSRDLERVMQNHLSEASRYVYLDKLKYRAITDMEQMGLSPFRSSNQQYPTLGPMVEAFLRDMNGQKSTGEAAADEVLDKMMSSKWGSPAVIGGVMGTAAAATSFFGIATNPWIGMLIGSYVGYRFYSSLKSGGEFKTRALTGDMMGDMAHAKLGLLLNASSAIVNLTQTIVNTLPVLKPKWTAVGFAKFELALQSYILGHPNADWRLLERTDSESINKFGEHKGARVIGTGSVKALFHIPKSKMEALKHLENTKRLGAWASMLAFDSTESLNRAVSFLGGYYRAKGDGKSLGESFREGERVMLFTQHNYGKSNKPEIIRNVFLRVPLQFKNYVFQQIAFTFDLAKKGATGRSLNDVPFDRDAIIWHLTSLFLLTGAIGLPFLGILAALLRGLFDYDLMDEMKKKALEMQSKGKLAAAAWTTLARGLPAAVLGEDLSSRAGMGEQFLPYDPSNPWGPWIGTVKNQIQLGEMQAGFVDQLANVTPAAKPFKAMEAMANGMPARDLILRPKPFFEALADDRIDWTNPWKNGYTEYDQTMISKRDVIRMGAGSTPITVAELRDVEKVAQHETDQHKKKTRLYVNRVISAARRFETDPAELNKVLDNVAAQMEKENFAVSAQTMQQSYKSAFTPRVLRTLKSVPRGVKPSIAGMIEPLMERQQPQQGSQ